MKNIATNRMTKTGKATTASTEAAPRVWCLQYWGIAPIPSVYEQFSPVLEQFEYPRTLLTGPFSILTGGVQHLVSLVVSWDLETPEAPAPVHVPHPGVAPLGTLVVILRLREREPTELAQALEGIGRIGLSPKAQTHEAGRFALGVTSDGNRSHLEGLISEGDVFDDRLRRLLVAALFRLAIRGFLLEVHIHRFTPLAHAAEHMRHLPEAHDARWIGLVLRRGIARRALIGAGRLHPGQIARGMHVLVVAWEEAIGGNLTAIVAV